MIQLDEQQRMIIETVKGIAQKELKPGAAEIDEKCEFPWYAVKVFTENGLLTPLLPEECGGIGIEYLLFSMIIEEIAKVCANSALILIAQADGMLPIYYLGSEEQKRRFLIVCRRGIPGGI